MGFEMFGSPTLSTTRPENYKEGKKHQRALMFLEIFSLTPYFVRFMSLFYFLPSHIMDLPQFLDGQRPATNACFLQSLSLQHVNKLNGMLCLLRGFFFFSHRYVCFVTILRPAFLTRV